MLRVYFRNNRRLLKQLCKIANECLLEFLRQVTHRYDGQLGMVMTIHTFSEYMGYNCHLHALVADGLFSPSGMFYVAPKVSTKPLEQMFRVRVIKMLVVPDLRHDLRRSRSSSFQILVVPDPRRSRSSSQSSSQSSSTKIKTRIETKMGEIDKDQDNDRDKDGSIPFGGAPACSRQGRAGGQRRKVRREQITPTLIGYEAFIALG